MSGALTRKTAGIRTCLAAAGLSLAVILAGAAAPPAPAPRFTLTIPTTTVNFGTVAAFDDPLLNAPTISCSVRNTGARAWCTVWASANSDFTATNGATFPYTRLEVRDQTDGVYHPLDNRVFRQRINRNSTANFSLRFQLRLTGDEPAGNYSLGVVITAQLL